MNIIDQLNKYKNELVQLGRTTNEKKFIQDSFTRWYLNIDKDDLVPKANVVNKQDLIYANKYKDCSFNVATFLSVSNKIYKLLLQRIKNIGKTANIYNNKDNLINIHQLNRLKSIYIGDDFENDKNKLISLYELMGINSIHLSVPPVFDGIELFGSPLNTHNNYCSAFEFEKKFGSLGSFFDFNIAKSDVKLFVANPPFDEQIMVKMAEHLETQLDAAPSDKPVTIIITIPVWDSISQQKLGIKDYGMQFDAYNTLISSKFLKMHDILNKFDYKYWNYYTQKLVAVTYTHLIILSNSSLPLMNIQEIKNKWQSYSK